LQLTPEHAAVLTIDLQEENRDHPLFPVADFEAVLARTAEVLAAARAAGVPVFHLRQYKRPDGRDTPALEPRDAAGVPLYSVAGTRGAELCPEVAPLPGEPVIDKSQRNGFLGTDLEARLRARGIDTLVVCGVWTESCVAATVFEAVFRGFRVWLVQDACGSGTRLMHRSGLLDIANRLYGGGVSSAVVVTSALGGRPGRPWLCERPCAFLYSAETVDALYESLAGEAS